MSIYVRGDTHGFYKEFLSIDRQLKEGDICIICGDCGLIVEDNEREHLFLEDLSKKPYMILFADGNHECFPAIYKYPEEIWNKGKIHRIRDNVLHLCRGQVFEIEGLKFFTFGGAYSIDKPVKQSQGLWWEEELPTKDEYEEGIINLEKHNWKVDYIITHTVDFGMINYLVAADRYGEIKPAFNDEHDLNEYLGMLLNKTRYKKWFFGHFHRDGIERFKTKQVAVYREMIKLN